MFDRIVDLVPDARVADIYSGVGTMGLESISRGAASCVFFEGTALVHRTLKENVETLAGDVPGVCWKTDVRYTSFIPKGSDDLVPYSLLFFDPPYAQCPTMQPGGVLHKSLNRLARPSVSSDNALLLVRTPDRFELTVPDSWQLKDCWKLSTMKIWNLTKPPAASDADNHAGTQETGAAPPDSA